MILEHNGICTPIKITGSPTGLLAHTLNTWWLYQSMRIIPFWVIFLLIFFSEQKTSKNDKYLKIVWLFKSHRNIWHRKQISHSSFSFLKIYQTYTLILFPWAPNIFYLFYNSLKHIYLGKVFFHTFHFAGWFSFSSYYQSWF